MNHEISAERIALLQQFGFSSEKDDAFLGCALGSAFCSNVYLMDTKMLVQGNHATDYAYLIYACETTEEGVLDGFFYSPSLLEYLLLDFGGAWSVEHLLKRINKQLDGKIRLVNVGGYPMLFRELNDDARQGGTHLRHSVSDMLKVIGQLDYLLPRTRDRLLAKRRAEDRKRNS